MPIDLFTEAYKEACASAPSDNIIYHTLEIVHPEVLDQSGHVVPIRFVRAYEDIEARIEATAEYNPGEMATFVAGQFTIVPQSVGEDRTPTLNFTLPNTDPQLVTFIELGMLKSRWMRVVYRPYLQNNLTAGPEMNPPLSLPVRSLEINESVITLSAAADNLVNRKFPNKTFNAQTHPGLVR